MKKPFSHLKLLSATLLTGLALGACQNTPRFFDSPALSNRFQSSRAPALNALTAGNMQVYFGNLHSHTSYSDGILTPREAYRMAIGNGLDFMAVTEHNHSAAGGTDGVYLTPKLYEDLKRIAGEFDQPGKFAALYGQEFSTISSGNHVNVFEASEIVNVKSGDFKTLYEKWLPAHPEVPMIQFNHPDYERDLGLVQDTPHSLDQDIEEQMHTHLEDGPVAVGSKQFNDYGYDDYNRNFDALVRAADPYVQTIEILNGPGTNPKPIPKAEAWHEKDYFFYLNQGFKLAPTADQDNHYAHWGSLSPARTGIVAPELSKPAIYAALRARRVFATEDNNLSLTLKANGHWMGETFAASPELDIEINLADADEPQAQYMLQIFADDAVSGSVAKPLVQEQIKGNQIYRWHGALPGGSGSYVFAKVTQTNASGSQDEAWTSPVWRQ